MVGAIGTGIASPIVADATTQRRPHPPNSQLCNNSRLRTLDEVVVHVDETRQHQVLAGVDHGVSIEPVQRAVAFGPSALDRDVS